MNIRNTVAGITFSLGVFTAASLPLGALAALEDANVVGLAVHQETGRNIYLAALRAPAPILPRSFVRASGELGMEYRVVARRTSIRSLLGGVLLQSELATGEEPSQASLDFVDDIIGAVQGSLYNGDSLMVSRGEGGEVIASLNGHDLASSTAGDVFDYFLMAWLGDRGPSKAFHSSILEPELDPALLSAYSATTVSEERIDAISAWALPEAEPEPLPAAVAAAAVPVAAGAAAGPVASAEPPAPETALVSTQATDKSTPDSAGDGVTASVIEKAVDPAGAETEQGEALQVAVAAPALDDGSQADTDTDIDAIDVMEYSQRLGQFNNDLIKSVYAEIRYPRAAVRRGIEGSLELDVTVDAQGKLLDIVVAQSSGYKMLDKSAAEAAKSAVKAIKTRIDPVAVAEYGNGEDSLTIPVPVSFILTQ